MQACVAGRYAGGHADEYGKQVVRQVWQADMASTAWQAVWTASRVLFYTYANLPHSSHKVFLTHYLFLISPLGPTLQRYALKKIILSCLIWV